MNQQFAKHRGWLVAGLVVVMAGAAFAFSGTKSKKDIPQTGSVVWKSGDVAAHRVFDITGKQSNKGLEYRSDVVLVGFHEMVPFAQRDAVIAFAGLAVDPTCESPYFFRLLLPEGMRVADAIRTLNTDPRVRYAEPDYIVHTTQSYPNDPKFVQLFGMHNTGQTGGTPDADIDAPEAWSTQTGDSSVVVAVIDTGVDYNHLDLTANILRNAGVVVGYDYANNDSDPMDDHEHGSHCSGTIGGKGNNGIGVAGVCHTVRIMPVKFLSAGGSGAISNAVLCTDFARINGANIMSNSWGGGGFSQAMLDAILRARDANILFVAAAGNNSSNNDATPFYPASYIANADNVMTVAATTHSDTLASFSNYGANTVDIAAPGDNILSTIPVSLDTDGVADGYTYLSGTSMACPHVAGAAALIKAQFPAATYDAIKARMMNGSDHPVALAGQVKSGRLNVFNTLDTDSTAPGTPIGLIACKRTTSTLLLNWVASGDDGAVGSASSYDLRFSTAPINVGNFASATIVSGTPIPQPSGSNEEFGASNLAPNTSYYFALRAKDNVGLASEIVTAGPYTTKAASWVDNVEGAAQFAATSGPWATTTTQSVSPIRSWTDSPAGNYANSINYALTQTGSFSVTSPVTFGFSCKNSLEVGYDYLRFEVSIDGGTNWANIYSIGGTSDWKRHSVSLANYVGQTVKVRFRLTSDSSVVLDGVYLDDFTLVNAVSIHLDNLEGANNYSGDAPWALTNAQSFSPTRSYTDSPAGNYVDNLNIKLTRNSNVAISGILGGSLVATCKVDLETNYDYLRFQLSGDNGGSYSDLGAVTGTSDWTKYAFAMPTITNAKMRFNLTTDSSIVKDGVYIDDISIVGEAAEDINTVMGQIVLGDFEGDVAAQTVQFEFRAPGGGTALGTANATLDASGYYSFVTSLASGTYDIYAKVSHWLPQRVGNVNVAGCVSGVNYALVNGNASNDDAEVNLIDVAVMSLAFGTTEGDTNWNPLADLDGDGEVTIIDFGIVSLHFGESGDE